MERSEHGIELEQVTVESPCSKRWQDLDGGDRRRFCGECSLHVVNLSALTSAEGQELLDGHQAEERLCVSFSRRADGSLVTAERVGLWRGLLRTAASIAFGLFPLLAACRPATETGETASGSNGGPPDEGPAGCIELTGEVALPDPEATHRIEVPEAILGRVALPALGN